MIIVIVLDEALPAPPPAKPKWRNADGKFDKVAYQRDLMRRRRAAEREARKTKPIPSS